MAKTETEFVEATTEQKTIMQQAEKEVTERQYWEYKEHYDKQPQSQVELDNRLLAISAKSAQKKELIQDMVKLPNGELRPAAVTTESKYPETLQEDLVKANLGDRQIESVWGNIALSNFLQLLGEARETDLTIGANFFNTNAYDFVNISRGTGGFSSILTKTDKHISEGVVNHVQQALIEKKKKQWGIF